MNKERSTLNKVNQETYGLLFKRLMTDPATAHELADVTGLHIITVQSLMRTLKRHKVVHITDWETDRLDRDTTPVFRMGGGRDKARRRMTRAEIAKRYRERKAASKPQVELAAFFGRPT